MPQAFARLLKNAIKISEKTQKELCDKVTAKTPKGKTKLTQPVLSDWTRAMAVPASDDPRVLLLAEVLEASLEAWQEAINADHKGGQAVGVLPLISSIIDEGRNLTELHGADGLQIWLLNPDTLPVLQPDAGEVIDIWAKNLIAGVSYHIVWTSDIIDTNTPEKFLVVSEKLAWAYSNAVTRLKDGLVNQTARPGRGIYHYCLSVLSEPSYTEKELAKSDQDAQIQLQESLMRQVKIVNDLRQLERESASDAGPPHKIIHQVFSIDQRKFSSGDHRFRDLIRVRRGIHEFLAKFLSSVAYRWPSRTLPCKANVCLNNVRISLDGPLDGYGFWLSDTDAQRLDSALYGLTRLVTPQRDDQGKKTASPRNKSIKKPTPKKSRQQKLGSKESR